MTGLGPRRVRERRTVEAMIALRCRAEHGTGGGAICPGCHALLSYAERRLERCPYGDEKPTCAKCPIHCYTPVMRETMRIVMREAGPKMLPAHPVLAVRHILDGRREAPERPARVPVRRTG